MKNKEGGECESEQGPKTNQGGTQRDPSQQSRKSSYKRAQTCKNYDMGPKSTREKRKRKRKKRKPDQDRATTAKQQGARHRPGAQPHRKHGGARRKKRETEEKPRNRENKEKGPNTREKKNT